MLAAEEQRCSGPLGSGVRSCGRRTLDFCVWLYTVSTRAMDLRTTLIFASFD